MRYNLLRYIFSIIAILFLLPAKASPQEERDSLIVSLVTCWPGAEIYELCGHEAIRIRSERMDSVWNYGVFDFNEPNFVYRFVKGETDYMLAGYPFSWFLPEYVGAGRKVVEQELNLTQEEARHLRAMLREESLPQNRQYRYNYVLDNCATRPLERIDSAARRRIVYPDNVKYGSFRNEMRHYHGNYPWYQFGIDLALGSGLDRRIAARQEMFVPVEMMEKVAGAHFADGDPLVRATRELNKGNGNAILPPTPWAASPMGCAVMFLAMTVILMVWMIWKKHILPLAYTIWYGICGIAGCVVTFLVFVSSHEATSPNVLLLWLNPLQFIFAVSVWWRKMRFASLSMAYYNILVCGIMLIIWPFQAQSANPAFFPFMGATLVLAAAYAIVEPRQKREVKRTLNAAPRRTASKRNSKGNNKTKKTLR